MATIYRVEDAHGYGPYCGGDVYGELIREYGHRDPISHPCSASDLLYDAAHRMREYRHGFLTAERLIEWFGPASAVLERNGYAIRRYHVAEGQYAVGRSGKQVVFDPTEAQSF